MSQEVASGSSVKIPRQADVPATPTARPYCCFTEPQKSVVNVSLGLMASPAPSPRPFPCRLLWQCHPQIPAVDITCSDSPNPPFYSCFISALLGAIPQKDLMQFQEQENAGDMLHMLTMPTCRPRPFYMPLLQFHFHNVAVHVPTADLTLSPLPPPTHPPKNVRAGNDSSNLLPNPCM